MSAPAPVRRRFRLGTGGSGGSGGTGADALPRSAPTAAPSLRPDSVAGVSLVGPSLLLVLGAALGAATQMSPQAAMSLRVPSLFAALFMVAQGLYEVDRIRRERPRPTAGAGPVGEATSGGLADGIGAAPSARPVYQASAPAPAAPPSKARAAIPALLMGLAAWLGLAVLGGAGDAAIPLSVLATLSAFLLFAIGWQVLLGTR